MLGLCLNTNKTVNFILVLISMCVLCGGEKKKINHQIRNKINNESILRQCERVKMSLVKIVATHFLNVKFICADLSETLETSLALK